MRCHENISGRIFVLKLTFLFYRFNLGSSCRKTMGFKLADPSTPWRSILPDWLCIYFCNNDFYNIIVVLGVSGDAESIYETLETTTSCYNRLRVTMIGDQSQGHNHGRDEPSHILSLCMLFWAREGDWRSPFRDQTEIGALSFKW